MAEKEESRSVIASRVQSPSSINTYRQCPRKYYYNYIAGLPTKKSIALIKGSIIHEVLEDFFDINPAHLGDDCKDYLRKEIMRLFMAKWKQSQGDIDSICTPDKAVHASDCMLMLSNWTEWFLKRIDAKVRTGKTAADAFRQLTPVREQEYISPEDSVRGFIDAIEEEDGRIRLIDYKTSSRDEITEEYLLQLSIYALLYRVRHGKLPDVVGLHFLRHGEKEIEATESMVEYARREIHGVHKKTLTTDKKDYVKKIGPLCKWSSGQCDFYDTCVKD
jgi:putative RecB family exonuclease